MDQMDLSSLDQMDLPSSALPSPQAGRSGLVGQMTDVSAIFPLAQVGPGGRVAAVFGLLVSIIASSWSNHSRSSSRGD